MRDYWPIPDTALGEVILRLEPNREGPPNLSLEFGKASQYLRFYGVDYIGTLNLTKHPLKPPIFPDGWLVAHSQIKRVGISTYRPTQAAKSFIEAEARYIAAQWVKGLREGHPIPPSWQANSQGLTEKSPWEQPDSWYYQAVMAAKAGNIPGNPP